jgi:ferric-dicitrate binding protein FerR (iron transport regulator)
MTNMRRISLVVLAATLAGGAAAAPAAAQAAQADIALVYRLFLDQRLAVVAPDAAERLAGLGERLGDRDVVVTSDNTRAAIRFTDDGSLLRLNPNSQVQIRAEGERSALVKTIELEYGELWARITRQDGGEIRVRTPAGVAAVKGTELIVRVGPEGTTVLTLEGVVEFFNDAGLATMTAGQLVRVQSDTDAPVATQATAADRQPYEELAEPEPAAGDELVRIEIPLQHADGRTRTIILEVPRRELGSLPGGGY